MVTLGIDPGVSPAVVVLAPRAADCMAVRVPAAGHVVDELELRAVFLQALLRGGGERKGVFAAVELVGPMPGQGLASTAHFMASWGIIRGVLCGMGFEYRLVTPQVWKRDLGLGTIVTEPGARKVAQKAAAVRFVQTHYPRIQLYRPRCRTPDHNLAEAVCMAHWMKERVRYGEV